MYAVYLQAGLLLLCVCCLALCWSSNENPQWTLHWQINWSLTSPDLIPWTSCYMVPWRILHTSYIKDHRSVQVSNYKGHKERTNACL